MALNIPMPDSAGDSLLKGLNMGSTMMDRIMQPVIEREKLKQQQDKTNALMPYLIQQYQDVHRSAANEADMKDMYRNLFRSALGGSDQTSTPQPQASGGMSPSGGIPPQMGAPSNPIPGLSTSSVAGAPVSSMPSVNDNAALSGQEHELRPGNPRLAKLDAVAGLVPGIPKAEQHITDGVIYTTYPSGRMTAQQVQGIQTPGEKDVSSKEASKLRDQATTLANSASLVQQGYDLLDNNPDLTGPGNFISALPIPFTGGKLNLSNNPELGKFNTVTGKLQAQIGKYAASRGGVQAVKWAAGVKPSAFNGEDYNYGMFDAMQRNLQDEYTTLNQQYKAVTGQDLPVPLPKMSRRQAESGSTNGKKIKKVWKLVNGQLV